MILTLGLLVSCLLVMIHGTAAAQDTAARMLFEHQGERREVHKSAVTGPTQDQLDVAYDNTRDWLLPRRDYAMSRYVPLEEINRDNASLLQPICAYQAGDTRAFHTNPIVYDGVIYLTTRYDAVAIDARTCRELWRQTWDARRETYSQANRGLALKDGTIFWGTVDGRLMALDASDGSIRWERRHADPDRGEAFTMPPLVVDDFVVIGVAGSESGICGWVGAFRSEDGESVWRFNIVPVEHEPAAETWGRLEALEHGGGGVWTPIALDAEKRHVYVGTDNPVPAFDGTGRPGDNLYTNSLLVLEAHTGKLVWYHQHVPPRRPGPRRDVIGAALHVGG